MRLIINFIYLYIYIYLSGTLCWQENPQLWNKVLKPPSLPINPKAKGIES